MELETQQQRREGGEKGVNKKNQEPSRLHLNF